MEVIVVYKLKKSVYNKISNTKGGIVMCSKHELNIILKKIAETYRLVYGDNLVKIMMYGSYARGDYDDYSDVDIAAIVKGERQALQNALKEVWDISADLELEYETIVSPTVIPFDEYEEYRNDIPYYMNIDKEGVVVVA